MIIYIMRHGETKNNRMKIFSGRYDEDLNPEGVNQALAAAAQVKGLGVGAVFCSPLLRARHTAMLVTPPGLEPVPDARLIERNLGELTLKAYSSVDWRLFWSFGYTPPFKGVEPLDSLCARVGEFLGELINGKKYKSALLVTHEGAAKAARVFFCGPPESGSLADTAALNGTIARYEC